MAQSSSSSGSNNVEPNFQKTVSEREVLDMQLHLNESDFDAFIKPYMSPGHILNLAIVGGTSPIIAVDAKTERPFPVKIERRWDGYLLRGSGVSKMVQQNIFVAGYLVSFSWLNGGLRVYRTN